jgi:adenine-specific DNA-methyltransferase
MFRLTTLEEEWFVSIIDDLLIQVSDIALRNRLQQEVERIQKDKKFGIVFEEHLPECTPLYNIPIKKGILIAKKNGDITDTYIVVSANEETAICFDKTTREISEFQIDDIVAVASFGDPIYPKLTPMDSVENAPESKLWHTLIEADNFYALQLLEYMYPKQVDCIYIDPPYNTGARDWKYNNNYVDISDSYRHSKWLSMMQKRLRIAKRLLTSDGVLAIAIDKNEIAHLVCLLEEKGMFSEYDLTIVSVVHNPRGNITTNFAETNEYVIYLTPKSKRTLARSVSDNSQPRKLRRWGHYSLREERRSMFYPFFVKDGVVISVGEQPPDEFHPSGRNVPVIDSEGVIEIWPIDQHGIERRWNYSLGEVEEQLDRIVALPKDGGFDLFLTSELSPPKTVWTAPELDAGGVYGSTLVEKIVGSKFPYPKSLYTVIRTIEPVLKEKPNALVVDFFAGSGTTLHAVNMINAGDNGKRRCVLVTNNEVSDVEAKEMLSTGIQPGTDWWESRGICQSITWPRTKYSIMGKRDDGTVLSGECITNQIRERHIRRNVVQIGFTSWEQLNTITLKKQLVALIGKNKLAQSLVKADTKYIVSDRYSASILFDDTVTNEWLTSLEDQEYITDFFVVTQNNRLFNSTKENIHQLLGGYIVREQMKMPLSDGFSANAEYVKLGFLDKNSVELGTQFEAILPILWMQSGSIGKRPEVIGGDVPDILIPEKSTFAVLTEESSFAQFKREISQRNDITYVYLVTDSQTAFEEMASQLDVPNIKQLYRDYIDNFTINTRRDI